MAVRWAIASGAFSSTATWNDGGTLGIPTTGDDVWTNGFTVTMDVNATVNSLNNNARARDIATPLMTANNVPSPFVAASSSQSGPQSPFLAFNRNRSTSDYWNSAAVAAWLSIDFGLGNSAIIDGYTIYGYSTQAFNPRNWTFEGSQDNSTWFILHTVTGATAIAASGTYSVASIGNPTAYRYYRVNITANGGNPSDVIVELELYQLGTVALAAGGSFNFNTSGVSVICTSTSASLSAGATNLIQVTATAGSVGLRLGSDVNAGTSAFVIIRHSGNCDFNLSGNTFIGGTTSDNTICISKTSSGNINITGNLTGGATGFVGCQALRSTAGNTVVIGNIQTLTSSPAINQSAGNLTVTGNVVGGALNGFGVTLSGPASQFTINGNVTGGSGSGAHGINFGGTLGTVNGNVTGGGGSDARGVNATVGGVNITGNVIGGTGVGIAIAANSSILGNVFGGGQAGVGASANAALTITITGDVYSSSLSPGVTLTQAATQVVNLTGNMYNTLGRMAIWCPNIFISNSATTLWRMDLGGGLTRTLYSADSFPNLPPTSDVRNLVQYGPASGLTGTMVVASPSDIRRNVLTDNTVGTADITAQDILNFINTSSDPLAVRMRTMLTDNSAGQLISEYNFV